MIDDLKPYPAMKDSGVPWLGEVPEHWAVQTVGRLGQLFKGNGGSKADEVDVGVPCVRYGDLYTRHEFFITKAKACVTPDRASAYTPIRFGDLLFAASGETDEDIGRSAVNLLQTDARCGGDVLVLRPSREFVPRFLGYAADSPASRVQKTTMGRGFTVVHIYGAQLKHLALAVPPVPEQAAIVRFLDYMDRRIRRYIRAKQKLIKLLEEQKQAIIHRAVTRGLDPNVRLKPSGVEWLGDVPEHWEVRLLGRCLDRIDQGWSPVAAEGELAAEQWAVLALSSVKRGSFSPTAIKPVPVTANVPNGIEVEDGNLLLTRSNTRELVGDVCIAANVRPRTVICDLIYRLVPDAKTFDSVFLMFQLLSRIGRNQIERDARGSSGTMPKIAQRHIRAWRVLIPPMDEQKSIVAEIDEKIVAISGAATRTQDEIDLLREYRTRLIADVVTGKLDVREAAARLPEEAEELEPLDEAEALGELDAESAADDLEPESQEAEA